MKGKTRIIVPAFITLFVILCVIINYVAIKKSEKMLEEKAEKRLKFLKENQIFLGRGYFDIEHLNNPNISYYRKRYEATQKRIDSFLNIENLIKSDSIPSNIQTFQDFLDEFPIWNNSSTSFIFHRDHPNVKDLDVLMQRVQKDRGFCFIHAPVMIQHYVVSMYTKTKAPIIDISKMISNFTKEQLENHFFKLEGSPSLYFLEDILNPSSSLSICFYKDIEMNLKQYGPVLVSYFMVDEDFYNDKHFHHYTRLPKSVDLHSMVLIGIRNDSNGNIFYLIQNWWGQKQFIEVDDNYLMAGLPRLRYVETPQYSIPSKYETNSFKYVECELDKSDPHPWTTFDLHQEFRYAFSKENYNITLTEDTLTEEEISSNN